MLIRSAEPDDALSVARVHVRAWQAGYRQLLPDAYLDALRPEERAQRYTFANKDPDRPATIVALDGQRLCGFATTAPSSDGDLNGYGELCALYVDPDWWQRGVGSALIVAARERLRSQGFHYVALWLLQGNTRGAGFYRHDGWAPDGTSRQTTVWGVTIDESRYCRAL